MASSVRSRPDSTARMPTYADATSRSARSASGLLSRFTATDTGETASASAATRPAVRPK